MAENKTNSEKPSLLCVSFRGVPPVVSLTVPMYAGTVVDNGDEDGGRVEEDDVESVAGDEINDVDELVVVNTDALVARVDSEEMVVDDAFKVVMEPLAPLPIVVVLAATVPVGVEDVPVVFSEVINSRT